MPDPLEKKINLIENLKVSETDTGKARKKIPQRPKRNLRIILLFLGILGVVGILGVIFGLLPLLELKADIVQINQESKGIVEGIQSRNLNQATEKLKIIQADFSQLKKSYLKLTWLKFVPWLNRYHRDGERLVNGGGYLLEAGDIALKTLEPYADLLGLEQKEELKKPEEMTTEERLILALDTLDKLQPSFDEIGGRLDLAQKEIDQINPDFYPETLFGRQIRKNIVAVVETIDGTAQMVKEAKPIISYLRPLLGIPSEKKYLLIFQNDAELRPTGGFLTAYAIMKVKDGKLTLVSSHDIYSLDARFGNRLKAPEPILNYHKNVFNWHLRDMNLSPDFKVSMETFLENYERVEGKGTVDGVIAVDTKVLVELLRALGPIGVPGWGNFSAENDPRCDCPQVLYELERFADKPVTGIKEERKAFIGPMMHSIILNAMGSPRKKWPEFFNLAFSSIQEKHILFYFFEEDLQKAIETLNAGGRIVEYNGDYLHINDCNFAGAKSNMFIKENVTQEIAIEKDGGVVKTLTIDYKNPSPPSNCNLEAGELCLNGLYRDWVRIYVPEGSELIEASGSEIEVKTYQELGKTVFEAFYGDQSPLRPLGKAQLQFKYRLPFKAPKDQPYKLLIQKQPGTYGYEYVVRMNGEEKSFELKTDKELKLQ